MENKRIGNIEIRKIIHWITNVPYWEVVKWFPNELYGKMDDFVFDESRNMYKHKDYPYCVEKSSFEKKECCYTLSIIREDKSDEPYVESVGSRPYSLTDEEFLVYKTLLKEFFENKNQD